MNVTFRAEFFDIANHTQFGSPNDGASGSNLGAVSSSANSPRLIRLGACGSIPK